MINSFMNKWGRRQVLYKAGHGTRKRVWSAREANIISSELSGTKDSKGEPLHRILLDIDCPVAAFESTTENNFHLYIDKQITWEDYTDLLKAMAKCGIIQEGYVEASLKRKATHLRLPWVFKSEDDGLSKDSELISRDGEGDVLYEKEVPARPIFN